MSESEKKFDPAQFMRDTLLSQGDHETAADALRAVQNVLTRFPALVKQVSELEPHDPRRIRPIEKCPRCPEGKMHSVGIRKPSEGHSPSGLIVCDTCGHYEGRR